MRIGSYYFYKMRVFQKKVTYEGKVFDSKDEAAFYRLLKDDRSVNHIHTQVRFNVIKPVWMMVPKQLKTKIRYDKRLLIGGHNYTADFVFLEGEKIVVCDVKSKYTASLREFGITMKAMIRKLLNHNAQKRKSQRKFIFRKAVNNKGSWTIHEYPPEDVYLL